MKISGKKPGVSANSSITKPGDATGAKAKKAAPTGKAAEGDKIDISSRAKDLMHVKNLLDAVPDIRSEMVVRLKSDIDSGNYYVDAGKVAEKMIERALMNVIKHKKV